MKGVEIVIVVIAGVVVVVGVVGVIGVVVIVGVIVFIIAFFRMRIIFFLIGKLEIFLHVWSSAFVWRLFFIFASIAEVMIMIWMVIVVMIRVVMMIVVIRMIVMMNVRLHFRFSFFFVVIVGTAEQDCGRPSVGDQVFEAQSQLVAVMIRHLVMANVWFCDVMRRLRKG